MKYQSIFKPGLFAGQTIVVTGGGSGIGRCTAHELSSLGANIVLVGRKIEKLESVASEIVEDGGTVSCHAFDIRDEQAVKEHVSEIVRNHGRIHGLVNNAGGQFPAPLINISRNGFEAVVRTNLVGGFLMAKEVFVQSMSQHGGAIVNMLAVMWNGMPIMGHSGAARAGMENLTKTAAVEWACQGVRVNAVAPGYTISSGMDTYDAEFQKNFPAFSRSIPLQRMGTESEISGAICFLLSDAAAYITGTSICIDGGSLLGTAMYQVKENAHPKVFDGFHRSETPEVFKTR